MDDDHEAEAARLRARLAELEASAATPAQPAQPAEPAQPIQAVRPGAGHMIMVVLSWIIGGVLTLLGLLAAAVPNTPSGRLFGLTIGLAGIIVLPPVVGVVRKRVAFMRPFWVPPLVAVAAFVVLGTINMAISSPSSSSAPTSAATASTSSAPAESAPTPPHNWTYREGQEYGYQAGLSEDQKKAGQAAADVQMFRYLGEHDGLYELRASSGGIASCKKPCEVIKFGKGEYAEHAAFDPNSVIGAAFTDAFNGQLEVYHPTKTKATAGDGGE